VRRLNPWYRPSYPLELKLNPAHWSLLALIPIASLFFIGGPNAAALPWLRYAWNLGHIGFFFVATLSICVALPNFSREKPWRYLAVIAVASLAIETIQLAIGRNFSLLDIARNLTGASLALAYLLKTAIPKPVLLISLVFLLFDTSKFTQVAINDWDYQQRRPLIENFESDQFMHLWPKNIARDQEVVFEGEYSGLVRLKAAQFSGISISPILRDWSDYRSIQLAVFNSQNYERAITIRIHDVEHELSDQNYSDRFNKTINLLPGWNQLVISLDDISTAPKNRVMDTAKMHQIGLFYSNLKTDDYMFIDDIRLEP
jgi:hypothetical protein